MKKNYRKLTEDVTKNKKSNYLDFKSFVANEARRPDLEYQETVAKGEVTKVQAIELKGAELTDETAQLLDMLDDAQRRIDLAETSKKQADAIIKAGKREYEELMTEVFDISDEMSTRVIETKNTIGGLSKVPVSEDKSSTDWEKVVELLKESIAEIGISADTLKSIVDKAIDSATEHTPGGEKGSPKWGRNKIITKTGGIRYKEPQSGESLAASSANDNENIPSKTNVSESFVDSIQSGLGYISNIFKRWFTSIRSSLSVIESNNRQAQKIIDSMQ